MLPAVINHTAADHDLSWLQLALEATAGASGLVLLAVGWHIQKIRAIAIPVGMAWASLSYFIDPTSIQRTAVGESFGLLAALWNGLWLLGAGGVIVRELTGWAGLERAGLQLLIGGWAIATFAALVAQGFDLRALVYVAFLLWALERLHYLTTTR